MKFAVLVRGIHYDSKYKLGIDYRKTIENFKEYVLEDLQKNGHSVDVYLSTYESKYYNDLVGCI